MGWLLKQYNDIKGNAKWALLGVLWLAITQAGKYLLAHYTSLPGWIVWAILLVVSSILFLWLARSLKQASPRSVTPDATQASSPISTAQSPVDFDARTFFLTSYQSLWTQDVERRIRIAAHQNEPNDHEGFYARLIGVGLVAYWHDITWAYIYRSQVLMLMELNRRGGLMPLADAKSYYDNGKKEHPDHYPNNYSLDRWIEYIKSRQLVIRHPTDMLEITIAGRDFLTYLAHYARTADAKQA